MRNPRVLVFYAIYMATRPRARTSIFHKTLGLMLYLLNSLTHSLLYASKHESGIFNLIITIMYNYIHRIPMYRIVGNFHGEKYSWVLCVVEHWSTNILTTNEATLPTFTCSASNNHEYINTRTD